MNLQLIRNDCEALAQLAAPILRFALDQRGRQALG